MESPFPHIGCRMPCEAVNHNHPLDDTLTQRKSCNSQLLAHGFYFCNTSKSVIGERAEEGNPTPEEQDGSAYFDPQR